MEKLFETSIPAETIRSRARAIQGGGKITTQPTTFCSPPENPDNQVAEANMVEKESVGGDIPTTL